MKVSRKKPKRKLPKLNVDTEQQKMKLADATAAMGGNSPIKTPVKDIQQEYKDEVLAEWRARSEAQARIEEELKKASKPPAITVKRALKGIGSWLSGEFGPPSRHLQQQLVHDAVHGNYRKCKVWLLKYGDHEGALDGQANADGKTALSAACENSDHKLVSALLRKNPSLDIPDIFGSTALHYAAQNGSERNVGDLLDCKATVDVRDNNGATPLMRASAGGHTACADLLIEYGASVLVQDTLDKWTPLHYAGSSGTVSLIKLLLQSGANRKLISRARETAEDIALNNKHKDAAICLHNWGRDKV